LDGLWKGWFGFYCEKFNGAQWECKNGRKDVIITIPVTGVYLGSALCGGGSGDVIRLPLVIILWKNDSCCVRVCLPIFLFLLKINDYVLKNYILM